MCSVMKIKSQLRSLEFFMAVVLFTLVVAQGQGSSDCTLPAEGQRGFALLQREIRHITPPDAGDHTSSSSSQPRLLEVQTLLKLPSGSVANVQANSASPSLVGSAVLSEVDAAAAAKVVQVQASSGSDPSPANDTVSQSGSSVPAVPGHTSIDLQSELQRDSRVSTSGNFSANASVSGAAASSPAGQGEVAHLATSVALSSQSASQDFVGHRKDPAQLTQVDGHHIDKHKREKERQEARAEQETEEELSAPQQMKKRSGMSVIDMMSVAGAGVVMFLFLVLADIL